MNLEQKLAELKRRDTLAEAGGGEERQRQIEGHGLLPGRSRTVILDYKKNYRCQID